MKKILVSILIVLAIPLVTFASWYNPFTWFPKHVAVVPVAVPIVSQETPASSTPQVVNNVRLVTTTDPKLQQQIDDLTKQENSYIAQINDLNAKNTSLSQQVADLISQNTQLAAQNKELENTITTPVIVPVTPTAPVIPSTIDVTLPKGNVYWNTPFQANVVVTQNGKQIETEVTVTTNAKSLQFDSSSVVVTLPYGYPSFTVTALGITKNITVSNVASNI